MKFSMKDIFSECDHIRSFLRIWPHLLKKPLMENLIFFCIVDIIVIIIISIIFYMWCFYCCFKNFEDLCFVNYFWALKNFHVISVFGFCITAPFKWYLFHPLASDYSMRSKVSFKLRQKVWATKNYVYMYYAYVDAHVCHFSQFYLFLSILILLALYRFNANYNVTFCAIWYHLHNLKTWKALNFTKVTLFHGCFPCFLKLYKWYKIAQSITYYPKEILVFCWTLWPIQNHFKHLRWSFSKNFNSFELLFFFLWKFFFRCLLES